VGSAADARRQCRSWCNKEMEWQEEHSERVEAGKIGRRCLAKEVVVVLRHREYIKDTLM